jgi:antirestriction protein ArdC
MLLSANGITVDMQNSASYIAGWLKALKNDPSLIISASGKAQRAADYIQGTKREEASAKIAEEVNA